MASLIRYKLKHPEIKSSAMDKLMAMVGLERIKRDALNVAYSVVLTTPYGLSARH
jgi:hypothetical protein